MKLTGLRTTSNQPGISEAIDYAGQSGAFAPLVIPAFAIAEVFHHKNTILEAGACVMAQVAESVPLDPAKVLEPPREQYGVSSRDPAFSMTSCGSPPLHTIAQYRAEVESNRKDRDARIGLIEALIDSGDVDSAFTEVKEALPHWPDDPYLRYLRGRLLVEKNDPDAAILELQWALKKENNHLSPANCALGRAFEMKGEPEAALGQYRTAHRAHALDKRSIDFTRTLINAARISITRACLTRVSVSALKTQF